MQLSTAIIKLCCWITDHVFNCSHFCFCRDEPQISNMAQEMFPQEQMSCWEWLPVCTILDQEKQVSGNWSCGHSLGYEGGSKLCYDFCGQTKCNKHLILLPRTHPNFFEWVHLGCVSLLVTYKCQKDGTRPSQKGLVSRSRVRFGRWGMHIKYCGISPFPLIFHRY